MLSWIIQITLISIILIFLVHHLIQFFKDTLTIPKVKDLVNTPTKKYESMFLVMKQRDSTYEKASYTNYDENYKKSLLPSSSENDEAGSKFDVTSMKNELKDYLKNQSVGGTSQISDLDLNFINSTQSTNW
jgi:hypothetical protein